MTSEEIAKMLDERKRQMMAASGEIECKACGVWFKQTHKSQIYCEECRKDKNIIRKMERRMAESIRINGTGQPVEMQSIICKECGREFQIPADSQMEFCSARCRIRYRREHAVCANCGKNLFALGIIINDNNKKDETLFCSDVCKEESEWRVARKLGYVTVCQYCGKEFINHRQGKFCSRECSIAWQKENGKKRSVFTCKCERCGVEFIANTQKRFCSRECYRETVAEEKAMREAAKDVKPAEPKRSVEPVGQAKALEEKVKKQAIKEAKVAQEAKERQEYIENNGLCGICRTPYKKCERMLSDFRIKPDGAVYRDGIIVECPKFK